MADPAAPSPDDRWHQASSALAGWRRLFGAMWRHAAGRRGTLLAAYALLLSAELLRLAVPWFAGRAIDSVQKHGAQGMAAAGAALASLFACIGLAWALHAPARILEREVAFHVKGEALREMLEKLLRAPLSWLRQEGGAQRAHRVLQAADGLHGFAQSQYLYLQNTVMLVGPIAMLWWLSPVVGAAATLGFGALVALSLRVDRLLVECNMQHNEAERAHHAVWVELLTQMLTVQALRGWHGARTRAASALQALVPPMRRSVRLNEAKWAMVDVGSAALWCSLVALYALLGGDGSGGLALGGLYMVYEYARRAENVMVVIAGDFGQLARQLADHDAGTPVRAAPGAPELAVARATAWQSLTLQSLRLPWSQGPLEVAARPRFELRRGRRVALVGGSGAGKSTLLRVLAGLEEPAAGHVLLDGEAVPPARLRSEATLLPQDATMFQGTLAEDLSMSGAADPAALAAALAGAGAGDFMADGPQAMTARVHEGGANWSGGQRQRLALARGLLAAGAGSLVLMDEPVAALDPGTQRRVLSGLLSALPDPCVVVSLHQFELLDHFDDVIVLEGGRLIDGGPRADVCMRCRFLQPAGH